MADGVARDEDKGDKIWEFRREELARLATNLRRGSRTLVWAVIIVATIGAVAACYMAWRMGLLPDFRPPLRVDRVFSGADVNANGVDDSQDIVDGARKQVDARPVYRSEYYDNGYPPENEGVCTDLVWRALGNAGYDLKKSVDLDICRAISEYPRVSGAPDPNIDFRRVPNLYVFLSRTSHSLATEVIPWDAENASEWQPGDIVIFGDTYDHIGVISDKRRNNGIPLVIHHGWGVPVEDNALGYWGDNVVGHFRPRLGKLEKL